VETEIRRLPHSKQTTGGRNRPVQAILFVGASPAAFGQCQTDTPLYERIGRIVRQEWLTLNEREDFFLFDFHLAFLLKDQQPQALFVQVWPTTCLDFVFLLCSIRRSRNIEAAMNKVLRAYLDEQAKAADDEVRQALELTKGNAVDALRITLIANAFLESEVERLTAEVKRLSVGASRGFGRKGKA
jgi:hypothetical protein